MFIRKHAALIFSSSFLLLGLAGCGGGVQTTTGNPSGFTNSNLKGTYSFAISGNNGGGFFAVAGSLTADGNGNITSGTEDINSPGTGVLLTNVALTGSYSVRSDGRTVATLTTSGLNPNVTFGLDLVLLTSSKALMMRFDQNGTASGTLDLQNSSAFSLASLAGAFAFNVNGVDAGGNSESSVGLINTDNAGNITGGSLDDNDSLTINLNLALAASALTAPGGVNGRGTATVSSPLGNRLFAYYVVDANHLKVIEIDGSGPFLAGDAFRQSSTAVSGSLAFTLAGATTAGHGVFVAGGVLNTDGAGNILNSSVEDFDNGGITLSPAGGSGVTGTYSVTGGRGTLQLNGPITLNLVFYPSTGGLQMLDVDNTIVASGTALQQSGAPFSNGSINNTYGLNFTGIAGAGSLSPVEIDSIAQFSATGNGTFTGAMDINNFGSLSTSLALNGNYSLASNGRGTAGLRTSFGTFNIVLYTVNNSQVLFIEMDENFGQISAGVFSAQ
jgi:hypothetical protein